MSSIFSSLYSKEYDGSNNQSMMIVDFIANERNTYSNNWSPTVKRKNQNSIDDYPSKKRKYCNIQRFDENVKILENLLFPETLLNDEIDILEFEKLNLDSKLNGIQIALQNNAPFALKIISFFNKYYKDRKDEMVEQDVLNSSLINIILGLINGFINSPTIELVHIHEYILLLGLLSRCNKGREYIISQGGLNKIVTLLVKFKGISDLFSSCLLAFGNLINTIQETENEFSKILEEENIVKLLLESMQTNQTNGEIVQLICFVLGNLVFIGFEETVLNENGIQIVTESIMNNLSNNSLLTEAIFLFKNLAYNEEGRIKLMEHKTIELIIPIIFQCIDYPDLVEIAVNLLYDLSFSGGIQILFAFEGVECLHQVIQKYQDNTQILIECVKTLSRAYSKSDNAGRIKILKIGSLQLIMNYLQISQDKEFFSKIEEALKSFTSYQIPSFATKPKQSFPTLKEICSMQVLNKCKNLDNIHMDLVSYFQEESKKCDNCRNFYFQESNEAIIIHKFKAGNKDINVPLYNIFCSEKCLHVKQNQV